MKQNWKVSVGYSGWESRPIGILSKSARLSKAFKGSNLMARCVSYGPPSSPSSPSYSSCQLDYLFLISGGEQYVTGEFVKRLGRNASVCISWKRQSMSVRQHQSISDQIDTRRIGIPRSAEAHFQRWFRQSGRAARQCHRLHISSHDILKLTWPKVWGSCRYRCSLLPLHLRVE